ncbi:MAG: NAD-dependent epimerase/dehydratase family protein [Candidatus Staskawiczbacteria bacterium]|nr:NAD-dependent epimerase/dehydratase family protein [Candidatus Staskawiczbacteria bacterium]
MKKFLIIGGGGFIGFHLSETLLKLGHSVVIIDDFSTSINFGKINSKIKVYKTDIDNLNRVKDIFKKEKPDFVYHLAGAINLRRQITDSLFAKDLNILARTKIILDACLENNVKKIIFISSGGAIYENAKIVPTAEDYSVHPVSLYGLANLMIERYIELYHKENNLNFIILRLSNVYGPRQWKSGIIPSIIIKILKKEKPIIYGDGIQTRDFIYIDDAVNALILAAEIEKRGIYNVGSGKEIRINEIFRITKNFLNTKIVPIHKNLKEQETKRSLLGIKKIKKDFGWQPKVGIKEGLDKTIEWFQKHE